MTASEVLRRMLDERGVEYATDDNNASNVTMWTTQNGGWAFDCDYMEPLNAKPGTIGAKTELMIYGYTPAQAIAATLGSGECEIETTENWLPAERYHRCKHCGAFFAVMNASGDIQPCVCPNCGMKVKR